MAVFLIPDIGLIQQLNELIVQTTGSQSTIRLFVNDYTPIGASVFGSFVEPTWDDYAPQNPTFPFCSIAANIAFTDSDEMQFECNSDPSSDLVYGYFCLDNDGVAVRFAERFTTPVAPVEGQPVRLTVKLRLRNP